MPQRSPRRLEAGFEGTTLRGGRFMIGWVAGDANEAVHEMLGCRLAADRDS
jgi:hypothetical protein